MVWQENEQDIDENDIPDDVVDLLFSIRCKSLPLDHGLSLSRAVAHVIPWVSDEPQAAIHQIHVAESSHGWQRPDSEAGVLLPSRRTRLILRMPAHRVGDCRQLEHQTFDIDGHDLVTESFKTRPLSRMTTLMARYIDTSIEEADDQFIARMHRILLQQRIAVKKMLSGLDVRHSGPEGTILTRKLMLAGLTQEDSLRLQQQGPGYLMLMGIGIFLPHKGIDAVKPG